MPSSLNIILTYILLVFIWSTTPLAIVWSVADINLYWALLLRFLIALPLSALLLLVLKIQLPFNRQAIHSYIAGAFSLVGSQLFTYAATDYLSSGVLALMFGLAPIMAGLIGRFAFGQNLKLIQWLGMTIAIIGLGIICMSGGQGQQVHPLGIFLMLISVFNYALSIYWVKKVNAQIEPVAQATGSILVSTMVVLLMVPFIWHLAPTHMPETKSILALIYTVVMASLIAMFCYFKLVQNIPASTLSLTTVMTPMLAMFFGAILNAEVPSLWVFLGASILIFGVVVYFYPSLQASRRQEKKQLASSDPA